MSKSQIIRELAASTGAKIIRLPLKELPEPLTLKEVEKIASMCCMLNNDFVFMRDTALGLRRVDNPHYYTLVWKYLLRLKMFYG